MKPEIKAVLGQAPDLRVIPVIAHAYYGDSGPLDQLDELSNTSSVLISGHSIDFIHEQYLVKFQMNNSQKVYLNINV